MRYYDLPHLSVTTALGPLHKSLARAWADVVYFQPSKNQNHPTVYGHKVLAQLVANMVAGELAQPPWNSNQAFFAPSSILEIEPLFVEKSDLLRIVTANVLLHEDFAAPNWQPRVAAREHAGTKVNGFKIAEDVPGKPGLIAADAGSTATFAFAIDSGVVERMIPTHHLNKLVVDSVSVTVTIGALKSYVGMGRFRARLFSVSEDGNQSPLAETVVDCLWAEHLSVYTDSRHTQAPQNKKIFSKDLADGSDLKRCGRLLRSSSFVLHF